MPITEQQLLQILPNAGRQAGVFVPVLNAAMGKYGIVTRLPIAAFIAQIGYESGHLTRLTWGIYGLHGAVAIKRKVPCGGGCSTGMRKRSSLPKGFALSPTT
ncbi:hypothetical protein PS720_04356 [Pseudomonas fluorescens]|nr:hypothetical protein PS720_04356 [Pseudomonas fluorescens]